MSEMVEVKINLPKKIYDALKWYIPQTEFGVADNFEESLDAWIIETVKQDLDAEINSGCEQSAVQNTRILKKMLGIE